MVKLYMYKKAGKIRKGFWSIWANTLAKTVSEIPVTSIKSQVPS